MNTVTHRYEFDNHPNEVGFVEIRENDEDNEASIVLRCRGKEFELIKSDRDHWGVYYDIAGTVIAQEDKTRSFIHALISALEDFREMNELETLASSPNETEN